MSDVVIFAVVFAVAGAFYVGLRRLGRRTPTGAAPVETGGEDAAENLGFVAENALRLARRRADRADRADDAGDGGGGGGDGG